MHSCMRGASSYDKCAAPGSLLTENRGLASLSKENFCSSSADRAGLLYIGPLALLPIQSKIEPSHVTQPQTYLKFAHAFRASLSSFSLSSNSQTSSSVRIFFFLLSLIFFSRSLMAFFLSLSVMVALFLTSILLPAPS